MTCSYEMKSLIILAFYFLSLFAHTNGDGFSSAFDLLLSRPLKQNSPPPDYASLIPNGTLFYKDENPRDPIFLDHNPKPDEVLKILRMHHPENFRVKVDCYSDDIICLNQKLIYDGYEVQIISKSESLLAMDNTVFSIPFRVFVGKTVEGEFAWESYDQDNIEFANSRQILLVKNWTSEFNKLNSSVNSVTIQSKMSVDQVVIDSISVDWPLTDLNLNCSGSDPVNFCSYFTSNLSSETSNRTTLNVKVASVPPSVGPITLVYTAASKADANNSAAIVIKISLASENSSDSDKSNHSTQTKTKSVSKRQTDNRNNGASPKLGDKLLSNESPSKSAKLEQKNIENEAKTETSEKPGRVGLIIANGTKISLVSVPTVPKNKPTEEQVKEPDLPRPISFEEFKEKSQLMFEKDYYNIELKTETKKNTEVLKFTIISGSSIADISLLGDTHNLFKVQQLSRTADAYTAAITFVGEGLSHLNDTGNFHISATNEFKTVDADVVFHITSVSQPEELKPRHQIVVNPLEKAKIIIDGRSLRTGQILRDFSPTVSLLPSYAGAKEHLMISISSEKLEGVLRVWPPQAKMFAKLSLQVLNINKLNQMGSPIEFEVMITSGTLNSSIPVMIINTGNNHQSQQVTNNLVLKQTIEVPTNVTLGSVLGKPQQANKWPSEILNYKVIGTNKVVIVNGEFVFTCKSRCFERSSTTFYYRIYYKDGTISQPIKVEMLEKTTPYLKLIQKGSISFRNGKLAKTCYITIVNGIPNQKYQLEMSDSNKIFQLMPLNELVFKLIQKVPIVRRADMEKLRVSLHDSGKALLTFADFDIKHEGDPTNIVEFAPVSVVPITVAVPDQPFTKLSLLNYNKDRVIYYLQMGNENGYFHVSTDGYVSLTKTAVAGIRNGQYSLRAMAVSEKTSDLLAITEFFAVVDLKSTDNIHSDVAFQKKFHVVHLTSESLVEGTASVDLMIRGQLNDIDTLVGDSSYFFDHHNQPSGQINQDVLRFSKVDNFVRMSFVKPTTNPFNDIRRAEITIGLFKSNTRVALDTTNILIYFIPKKQTTDNSLDTKKIVKIPSDSPVGTVVGVASGMTAITNFTLEGPLSKYFEVDHMGIIRIQKKFEKDVLCTNEAHTFVVKSNDAAFETKQFFIELLDRKTFVSNISLKNSISSILISENATVETAITDLQLELLVDPDGELENITLALHGKGHRNFHLTSNIDFMLDEFKERQKTAVKSNEHCQTSLLSRKQYVRVSLRNELDFESVQSYNLILLINSGKFTVSVPLHITVVDVNDNTPKFDKNSYDATITDSWPVGGTITKLFARDSDTAENGKVSYAKLSGDESFIVDPDSGEIKSIRPLANKAAEQAYALKIVAFDHGSPRRSSEVNVMIKIRPQIPDASGAQIIEPSVGTNIRLEENQKIGTVLFKVVAKDMDDPKEPIIYSLDGKGDEHYFKINPNTGEITVVKLLDREIEDNLAIVVSARSKGASNKVSHRLLQISLVDENDNLPTFAIQETNIKLKSDVLPNSIIGQVTAVDSDLPPNNKIFYHLLDESNEKHFGVNTTSGLIVIQKGWSVDENFIMNMYPLCVLASSQEFPQNAWKCDLKNSSFAKVTVSVRKVYKTNRKEQNSKIETPYLSIEKSDLKNVEITDFGTQLANVMEIKNGKAVPSDKFSITKTGKLKASPSLRYSADELYQLKIGKVNETLGKNSHEMDFFSPRLAFLNPSKKMKFVISKPLSHLVDNIEYFKRAIQEHDSDSSFVFDKPQCLDQACKWSSVCFFKIANDRLPTRTMSEGEISILELELRKILDKHSVTGIVPCVDKTHSPFMEPIEIALVVFGCILAVLIAASAAAYIYVLYCHKKKFTGKTVKDLSGLGNLRL